MAQILIIDDDSDFRRMLIRMLKQADHEVVEASNGEEAMKIYQKDQTDLVITDIFMPEKEGIETVKELRENNPKVKIIVMSGGGANLKFSYLDQMKLMGVQKTFEKPFVTEDFLKAVKELLEAE